MRRSILSIFAIVVAFTSPAHSATTTSLTQHGITWTFASPVEYGQFVNGDYWVVDPGDGVAITAISPGATTKTIEGEEIDQGGSMLNPFGDSQGYAECQNVADNGEAYSASLNVGRGVSGSTPLVIAGGNSLVSTTTSDTCGDYGGGNHVPYVINVAVLTVLPEAPPSGSFRPGISSTTKTIHNISQIDWGKLATLSVPLGQTITAATLDAAASLLQMPHLLHSDNYMTRYMRPSGGGLDNYYFVEPFATSALYLHLNFTTGEKQRLLYNFIQMGIDFYSFVESEENGWDIDGGHWAGRKWPILFAGIMLDYAPMKNIGQRSGDYLTTGGYGPGNPPPDYVRMHEDGQTFYVRQWEVDNIASYTQDLVGMPEWGIRHATVPSQSNASWLAAYRNNGNNASAWAGFSLSARIMGAQALWNHNAFFDYVARYAAISTGKPDPFGYVVPSETAQQPPPGFIGAMWDEYDDNFPFTPPGQARRLSLAGHPIKLAEPGP